MKQSKQPKQSKKLRIIENQIAKKIFSNKELTTKELTFYNYFVDEFYNKNKNYIENNWDIVLSDTNMGYYTNPKNYFIYKARMKRKVDYSWLPVALAEFEIDRFFNNKQNEEDVDSKVLFKSNKILIEAKVFKDKIHKVYLTELKTNKVYSKQYYIEDLPIFKNTQEVMK